MTTAAGFLSAVTVIGNAASRRTATMPVAGGYVYSRRIGHACRRHGPYVSTGSM